MVGVSHRDGETTQSRFSNVGVSLTHWDSGIELVVLTNAYRGCFCDKCCNLLSAASRVLSARALHNWGPFWDLDCEWDVFYHCVDIRDRPENEILSSTLDRFTRGIR